MKQKLFSGISLALRLISGAVFVYAGWQKLWTPQEFADGIAAYQLLPAQAINILAMALPPLELMVGCLLIVGWQRRVAAFSALTLTGVFVAALASAIARGLTIDCGCFGLGTAAKGDLWLALGRDGLLGAGLAFVYFREIVAVGIAGNGMGIAPVDDGGLARPGGAEAGAP